ncbi:hypothetical protein KGQ19_02180 [Catenulispora sp. NL8]|uniref:Uncharacterized protein n=1 Tax=Catenulispora pinistramenti TaxID=2705254 RepID=A0ABS5KHE0_9ACTN|nr:hypothetical protein [Catenulispora pinistramenti]MBS2545669.1 hypothetical protein [Catenulispora pinistramenti]
MNRRALRALAALPALLLTATACQQSPNAATGKPSSDTVQPAAAASESSDTASSTTSWITFANGHLAYGADSQGNRVPDFSYAGYGNGKTTIPTAPVAVTLKAASSGDDTSRIQAAIAKVSALPLNADGLRGAVLLGPGDFRIGGALTISASGVVLRGSGSGTGGTHLVATGTPRAVVSLAGSGQLQAAGAKVAVTDDYVPIGATTFHVASTADLKAGQAVVVQRPQEQNWIHAIGMDKIPQRSGGGTVQWKPNAGLQFERTITALDPATKTVTIDIPLTNALEKQYTHAVVWPYTFPGRISDVGVEHLSADGLAFTQAPDYATTGYFASSFASFDAVDGGWARDIVADDFGSGMGGVGESAKRITLEDTSALGMEKAIPQDVHAQPVAYTLAGQQSLVLRCQVSGSNLHAWATQAQTAGPNVFSDCTATNVGSKRFDAGPHQRWASGTLYDHLVMREGAGGTSATELSLYDRDNEGSGQGWAGATQVAWNSDTGTYSFQSPPTSYNWSFGALGKAAPPLVPGFPAVMVSAGTPVQPASLYAEQLAER